MRWCACQFPSLCVSQHVILLSVVASKAILRGWGRGWGFCVLVPPWHSLLQALYSSPEICVVKSAGERGAGVERGRWLLHPLHVEGVRCCVHACSLSLACARPSAKL